MKSLQESLFDKDLVEKEVGILSVITNSLKNYLSKKTSESGWTRCLLSLVDDIKYNIDSRKRYHLGLDRALKMKDDELYIYIGINEPHKKIFLLGKGLDDLYPKFPIIIEIGYSRELNNLYSNIHGYMTTFYKEMVNNENFQHYKVTKGEIKTFIKEILDNIEQVF